MELEDLDFVFPEPKEKTRSSKSSTLFSKVYPPNTKWFCGEPYCLYEENDLGREIKVDKHGRELDWEERGFKKPRRPPICHKLGATNLYMAYKTLAETNNLKPTKMSQQELEWSALTNVGRGHMACNLDKRNKPKRWDALNKKEKQEYFKFVLNKVDWGYDKKNQKQHDIVQQGGWENMPKTLAFNRSKRKTTKKSYSFANL